MATGITKARRNVRSRKMSGQNNGPVSETPVLITDASVTGSVLTLTFDQVVRLEGTPAITTNLAATPVSAEQPVPNQVSITYNGTITGATSLNLAYRDPAIRSASGGYVTSTQLAIAA